VNSLDLALSPQPLLRECLRYRKKPLISVWRLLLKILLGSVSLPECRPPFVCGRTPSARIA
jgi:hypothetical protein